MADRETRTPAGETAVGDHRHRLGQAPITGWNAAYLDLYPNVATVDAAERNLLWLVFTDPYVRSPLPDWEVTSRRFLAEFRAEAGPRVGDLAQSPAVQRLLETSPEFRAAWQDHHIEGFTSRLRAFDHPTSGPRYFEHHRLAPADHPDLYVVVYTPAHGAGQERPSRRR
ncbi:hypothetical protein GCM10010329_16860 [Streptomyces spiroverticillatus]|uniref:MmyB-like transcription regulator ligand binding domain-containing protein n=1 Tax=Streptomyces finlayi TaxID=67296 RepID=A0A919C7J4_9ACTN|nr:hypothetical protein [Streptomyces finlayi]GGZ96281.1 hypothetical protein GCM10010329_16860 [Streptomyces spiroverticillatus]GHC81755.1 hypothetical protein GCM10010334_09340 [Streptomyces finlayi]